jgi:catechol 2,3-dioxygenase-like lactoylglutathione lyase family enzyme
MLEPANTNLILYCEPFQDSVQFYQWLLGQPGHRLSEWLIEFRVVDSVSLSVADPSRCTIAAGDGRGLTISWQVKSLGRIAAALAERKVKVQQRSQWGATCLLFLDPAGNRIEVWCPLQSNQE